MHNSDGRRCMLFTNIRRSSKSISLRLYTSVRHAWAIILISLCTPPLRQQFFSRFRSFFRSLCKKEWVYRHFRVAKRHPKSRYPYWTSIERVGSRLATRARSRQSARAKLYCARTPRVRKRNIKWYRPCITHTIILIIIFIVITH